MEASSSERPVQCGQEKYLRFNAKLNRLRFVILGGACWFLTVIIIPDAVLRLLAIRHAPLSAVRIGLSALVFFGIISYLMIQISTLTKVIRPVVLGIVLIILGQLFRVIGSFDIFSTYFDPLGQRFFYAICYVFVGGLGMLCFSGGLLYAIVELLIARNEAEMEGERLAQEVSEHKRTEERLRVITTAVEQSREGIAVTDIEGNLEFANQAFAEMHGYQVEELLGKHLSIFHTAEQMPVILATNQKIREQGLFTGEIWHVRRDGKTFPAMMNNSLLRDEAGKAMGIIGTAHDITARKQAEEVLQRRDAILEAVAQAAQGFLHATSWEEPMAGILEGLCTAAEASRCHVFEFYREEGGALKARQRYEWVAPEVPEDIYTVALHSVDMKAAGLSRWMDLLHQDKVICGDVGAFPKGEQEVLLRQKIKSLVLAPVFSGDLLWGFVGCDECCVDRVWEPVEVEALKTAANILGAAIQHEENARTIEAQRKKISSSARLSSLGVMAGGIAHEINNPLANISVAAEQLARPKANRVYGDEFIKLTANISRNVLRIARIVRSLRSLSRKNDDEAFTHASIRLSVEDSLELCRERFRISGIKLIEGFPPEDIEVDFRPTQISQVVMNLLNNAYDAIESLPEKWVEISLTEQGAWVELSVTDSGAGLPDNLVDQVFEPFLTTKEIGKGTGLGLSISKRIVDDHGGELFVDTDSSNTRFIMRLPKKQHVS